MKITSALGGAGFAFAAYAMTLVVSVLVAGMIQLTSYVIRKRNPEARPAASVAAGTGQEKK